MSWLQAVVLLLTLALAPGGALLAAPSKAGHQPAQKPAKAGAKPSAKSGSSKVAQQKARPPARSAAASKQAAAKNRARPARAQDKRTARQRGARAPVARAVPRPPSYGQMYGLHNTADELDLKSSVALVVDPETDEVLFSKNSQAVLPIASITKLMTALVVSEAQLDLDEILTVTQDDVRATAGSRARSRLQPGTRLARSEMLHLALMSSENRAAHLLGRTYPGGMRNFVEAMNAKARELGMQGTRYVEPTGLSAENQSSAEDLARLVRAASEYPLIREMSTTAEAVVPLHRKPTQFRNTNGLVHNTEWEIELQKTGYISAAGRCVVMQAQVAGRKLIMVLLDSAGRYSRIGDAERLRAWLDSVPLLPAAHASNLPAAASMQSVLPLHPIKIQQPTQLLQPLRQVQPVLPVLPVLPVMAAQPNQDAQAAR